MPPISELLDRLSKASRKTLQFIVEGKDDDDFDRDLASLRAIGKRISGMDLSASEELELYLEIYFWALKVKDRREGIWDDDYESYDETEASA